MRQNSAAKKLYAIYIQALEQLELSAEVMAHAAAGDDDRSAELALMEAAYETGCFKRAVRTSGAAARLGGKLQELQELFEETLDLLDGGEKRLMQFMDEYFAPKRLEADFRAVVEQARNAATSGIYDELRSDEMFQQKVIDYFIFFDRFACLGHPQDTPLAQAEEPLHKLGDAMQAAYRTLKPLFSAFGEQLRLLRQELLVPREPAYGQWFDLRTITAEAMIKAYETQALLMQKQRMASVAALVAALPKDARQHAKGSAIRKRLVSLAQQLGGEIASVLDQIGSVLSERALATETAWSTDGKKTPGLVPEEISRILDLRREALKKTLYQLEREQGFSPGGQRDIALLSALLIQDFTLLKKYSADTSESDEQ